MGFDADNFGDFMVGFEFFSLATKPNEKGFVFAFIGICVFFSNKTLV